MQQFEHPIRSGVASKCGRCGTGPLFKSYLKFRDSCPDCGLDYSVTDTADGPAFFVSFIAMILFTPAFIIVSFLTHSLQAQIIGYVIATVISAGFCLLLLPPFKGILFNLQVQHQSGDPAFEYTGTHGAAPENWKRAAGQKKDK